MTKRSLTLAMRGITLLALGVWSSAASAADPEGQADIEGFKQVVAPYLQKYCIDCHGVDEPRGKLSLHDIDPDLVNGSHMERWRMILEQVEFGLMPPKKEARPDAREQKAALDWLRGELHKTQQPGTTSDRKLSLPQYGNYVDHEELFRSPAGPIRPSAPRLWRMRPEIYKDLVGKLTKDPKGRGASQPFAVLPGDDFKDFAAPYYVDEPTADMLFRNAELIVEGQTTGKLTAIVELKKLVDPVAAPSPAQVDAALRAEFRLALRRDPTADELARFRKLYARNVETGGHVVGARETLVAILMLPETIFRTELGQGPTDELGRRRLSPTEAGVALSYALRDAIDADLVAAATGGKLVRPEDIARHVDRLLEGDTKANPRLMQFFREYFGYEQAADVFKDKIPYRLHDPDVLVSDLEHLIRFILQQDRQVLKELLTTRKAFIGYGINPASGAIEQMPRHNAVRGRLLADFANIYELPVDWRWTPMQPVDLPGDNRAGVLTHPAWLVAWSGNFDNHPVQRGKWIRTHLLGGYVPDVPIGVDAMIPEDPHKKLGERLRETTQQAECWRCHRKMDDLGLPFEMFDHFGRYRDLEAGKPATGTGLVAFTGDPKLDGPVDHPVTMLRKLAESERVEQVFVRHAFRFFLGRNETLGDAKTLQDAHCVYRDSGGSFKALVKSLLTSDSFHCRAAEPASPKPIGP